MSRPICCDCGLEMIFVVISLTGGSDLFKTWQCDCEYREIEDEVPSGIVAAIVRAREGDEYAVHYNWGQVVDHEK